MLVGAEKATLIVGHYGSGKSEVAVNFALWLRAQQRDVTLVDLDLVNPYFRSREAVDLLEKRGIRVVLPKGYMNADLPILVPEVRSQLQASSAYGILDVGGDDVGARVLGALHDATMDNVRVLMVLNNKRPFADTLQGTFKMQGEIEAAAKLRVTGYVSNAHMMDITDRQIILAGWEHSKAVAQSSGIPLEFVTAPEELAEEIRGIVDVPVLAIHRHLLPPWLQRSEQENVRAVPPRPLFGP